MRCIKCGSDSNYKDRQIDRRCDKCGHEFTFEPQEGDSVTDRMFHKALLATSSDFEVYWLKENLHYELCRRMAAKKRRALGCGCLMIIPFIMMAFLALEVPGNAILWVILATITGILFFGLRKYASPYIGLAEDQFNSLWGKWCAVHGVPEKLVVPGLLGSIDFTPDEPDLADYSFDRVVVCQRREIVDLLVANDFHFENNCAVLSADGYPGNLFGPVRQMLMNNPDLHVSVYHDASFEGVQLADKLRADPKWFPPTAVIEDVGLHVSHARKLRGLYLPASYTQQPVSSIGQRDKRWLSKYEVSLLAIQPAPLMKGVFAAFSSPDSFG